MKDEANKIVRAMLAHNQMEEVAAYLRRGRRFQTMPEADLNQAWAAAFEVALGLGVPERQQDLDDLGAELNLRNLEPPGHLVKETMDKLSKRVSDMSPEAREAAKKSIGEFMLKMEEPKN